MSQQQVTETPFSQNCEALQTIARILTDKELEKHIANDKLLLREAINTIRKIKQSVSSHEDIRKGWNIIKEVN